MRLEAGRYRAARGLVSALFVLACAACRMASLPRGESVAAARSASPAPARHAADSAVLRVVGRHFVGPDGRVVLLRGVNLGGDGKLPPFPTPDDPVLLDRLTELGFNAIRLPFIWEAYEPEPGRYDEAYLTRLVAVAATAWARGIYVIIDIHQDGFARTLCYGCGAGFPLWAVSPRATPHPPDNGCGCKGWPLLELTDPGVYRSFADFYADAHGVRARYLAMLGRVAGAFAAVPGVVGYDPLNEPWGDERREIAPLYRDAAAALRARHPTAILFLEGRGPTATGFRTRLPRPGLDNIAFAPHYYKPLAIVREDGGGRTAVIDRAFGRMEAKAAEWGVPLLVGEFGIPGGAAGRRLRRLSLRPARRGACLGDAVDRLAPPGAPGRRGVERRGLQPARRRRSAAAELPATPLSASGGRRARVLPIRGDGAAAGGTAPGVRLGAPPRTGAHGDRRAGRAVPAGLAAEGRARRRNLPLGPLAPAPDLRRPQARDDPRRARVALNRRSSAESPLWP